MTDTTPPDGGRITDEKTLERIENQAKGFIDFVKKVKG